VASTSAKPTEAPGFIALEGGDSRVEVVPGEGGRVRSLHLFGREWLVAGPAAPDGGLMAGAGWVEHAPAAAAGAMPEWVKGFGGRANAAGGEALRQRPEVALATESGAHRVTCTWRGRELPWELTRSLLVRQDGAVEARYEARTTGQAKLPFLWSAGLLFPLDAGTRLQLPEGARFRVSALEGAIAGPDPAAAPARSASKTPVRAPSRTPARSGSKTPARATSRTPSRTPVATVGRDPDPEWPRLRLDGKACDLGSPWSVPRRTLLTGWLDLGGGRSVLQVWQGDERLTITCDGGGVPYCGLTIDRGGTATAPRRGMLGRMARGEPAVMLRPSLGAPDRLADALGEWKSMTWLVPGETRRWTLTLRGGS
jgi:hypothetical protein